MLQVEPQQHIELPFRVLQLQRLQPKHTQWHSPQAAAPPADSLSLCACAEQAGCVLDWLAGCSAYLLFLCDNPVVCQHQQGPGRCACSQRQGSSQTRVPAALCMAVLMRPSNMQASHLWVLAQLLSLTAPDEQPLWECTQRQLPMQLC
jgi:hypothetical protein